ncbi:hypothetical protein roselon_02839 [Roseibacterium elongatum DSM 19469]|uniref:Uncharacterized protein n=1 Tax=Roseicyclus elongatus DSM 19469 TaxID=1294273 RepID=W8S4J9_9RHOB|nr:hypothetical protein [Roseibacterium elongatum]AHM05137.1 hypothetical protein roselon_02839 [Roseibacterium elongatum DSM 19469]
MSLDAQAQSLRLLVVHHDLIVLEDLCETLAETGSAALVDRADTLRPDDLDGQCYDAALIEVSRNATAYETAFQTLSKALARVIWITDDMHPAPETPLVRTSLRQPFRTEDVTTALEAAGVLLTGMKMPRP